MGSSLINWRFGSYHFQINFFRPWVRLSHNPYHADWREKGRPFFEAYR